MFENLVKIITKIRSNHKDAPPPPMLITSQRPWPYMGIKRTHAENGNFKRIRIFAFIDTPKLSHKKIHSVHHTVQSSYISQMNRTVSEQEIATHRLII